MSALIFKNGKRLKTDQYWSILDIVFEPNLKKRMTMINQNIKILKIEDDLILKYRECFKNLQRIHSKGELILNSMPEVDFLIKCFKKE